MQLQICDTGEDGDESEQHCRPALAERAKAMKEDSIHEMLDHDTVTRWDGQWHPRGGWRTIPIASVALTFVLGGCSLGYGGSSATAPPHAVPTAHTAAVPARPSQGSAAPASVYTSRNGVHQLHLALEVRHGACAFLPVFDDLRQGTQRYSDVEAAIEMQLYGSAPADDKDAISYFQQAQTALTRMDAPASLTQVQLLLQSATDSYLAASEALRPELGKNKVKVLPTHRAAYKRGQTLAKKATAQLRLAEAKAGIPNGTSCPGYTPPSQNVFDNSELDFTTGLSAKRPVSAPSTAATPSLAVAVTPVTRVIYVTRPVYVPTTAVRATTHVGTRHQPHSSVPTPEPMPAQPTQAQPTPAPATKAPRPTLLSIYVRSQELGLTHLQDASSALKTAIRDVQHHLFADAQTQLNIARQALFSERSRLSKQKPPTADLRLVRDREHRAIKAYVNAYGWAVRALTSERLSGVTVPSADGTGPVIEFEPPVDTYLQAARNGMQRAGVRWHKARKLLHSIHP